MGRAEEAQLDIKWRCNVVVDGSNGIELNLNCGLVTPIPYISLSLYMSLSIPWNAPKNGLASVFV